MASLKHTSKKPVRKTTEEIDAEISRLKALEGKLPHHDEYGGSNWRLLEAQIRTLKNRMSMDEIVAKWDVDDDAQGAAEDARFWMDGGEVLSPFDWWGDVKKGIEKPA